MIIDLGVTMEKMEIRENEHELRGWWTVENLPKQLQEILQHDGMVVATLRGDGEPHRALLRYAWPRTTTHGMTTTGQTSRLV